MEIDKIFTRNYQFNSCIEFINAISQIQPLTFERLSILQPAFLIDIVDIHQPLFITLIYLSLSVNLPLLAHQLFFCKCQNIVPAQSLLTNWCVKLLLYPSYAAAVSSQHMCVRAGVQVRSQQYACVHIDLSTVVLWQNQFRCFRSECFEKFRFCMCVLEGNT